MTLKDMTLKVAKLTLLVTPLLCSVGAFADVPVSMGTDGSLERAAQTVTASRNASAASFGSTSDDDRRLFKLRWRIPFFQSGEQVDDPLNAVLPFGATDTVHGFLPGLDQVEEGLSDLTSYIPQIEFGEEKKMFRLQAGVLSTSIGHGTLIKGYTNAPEGARRSFGLLLEGNLAGIGGQAIVGNLLAPQSFAAARAYIRPLLLVLSPDAALQPNEFDLDPRTESLGVWVVGLTAAVDAGAPTAYVDSEAVGLWDTPANPAVIWAVGIDNEAALLDNQLSKFIPYLDINIMGGTQAGLMGSNVGIAAHPGVELMFDLAGFRLDLDFEYSFATDGYVPRYFDRLYATERFSVLGRSQVAKAGLDTPASHGYRVRASAGILEMFTVFAEAHDQFAFDGLRGGNSATFTAGASGWVGFFGGNVVVSQSGVSQYSAPGVLGPGFVFLAEGRVAVPFVFNTVHFIGRYYKVHDVDPDSADGFTAIEGALVGMEINLDFL
ncbi:MAG: hypothetical protein GY822_30475 [Deltaproteobacteria bacterium]|nr:hypothetical protein [Deltaproteobacteria bacterium]